MYLRSTRTWLLKALVSGQRLCNVLQTTAETVPPTRHGCAKSKWLRSNNGSLHAKCEHLAALLDLLEIIARQTGGEEDLQKL